MKYHVETSIAVRTLCVSERQNMFQKKSGSEKWSFSEKLILGGILVSIAVIIISIFVSFRPFTWEDLKHTAAELKAHAASLLVQLEEWSETLSPSMMGISKDDTILTLKAAERPDLFWETADIDGGGSVSHMDHTGEVGKASDFNDSSPNDGLKDVIYSCILDTSLGPMVYYNQGDIRWRDYLYGGQDPMSRYGCGPTCVAMVINSFGTASVSPIEMADWSAQNGGYATHSGSYHNLIPDSISAFGLNIESVTERTPENAAELLRSGHLLIALMGKGSLTEKGHFIVIAQLCENGNVYIADPANYENSVKEWDLRLLMDELKKSYDFGGPLWAVSLPDEG